MPKKDEVLYSEDAIAAVKDELMAQMEEMINTAMKQREAKATEDKEVTREQEDAIAAVEAEKDELQKANDELNEKLTRQEHVSARSENFANFGLASDNKDHENIIDYLIDIDDEAFAAVTKLVEVVRSAKADKEPEKEDEPEKENEPDKDKKEDADAAKKDKKIPPFMKKKDEEEEEEDPKKKKDKKAKATLDVPNKAEASEDDDKFERFRKGLKALEGGTFTLERKEG